MSFICCFFFFFRNQFCDRILKAVWIRKIGFSSCRADPRLWAKTGWPVMLAMCRMFRLCFNVKWGLVLWRICVWFSLWPLAHCFIEGQQLTWAVFWERKRWKKNTKDHWLPVNLWSFVYVLIQHLNPVFFSNEFFCWEMPHRWIRHLQELRICTEALAFWDRFWKDHEKRECWNMFNF